MPIYLSQASYTHTGVQGLIKEGGSKRRDLLKSIIEKGGGKLLGFYFATGQSDVIVLAEFADRTSALALSVAVNATGAVRLTQVELIPPEEMDAAIAKLPAYRAPGA